jgi:tetratricopeptide (TPR) repeat protein
MGKSRLLLEFRRSLGDDAAWLEGRCISWGQNFPYLPVVDIVRGAFDIGEGDDDQGIVDRIDSYVGHWGEAGVATAPYLKYLLNVDPGDPSIAGMDPVERRVRILDALRVLLRRVARAGRPAVVVVEDLHWADEQSQEALAALIDAVPSAHVLLIITHRPGYAHALGDRTYYSRLALRNLAPEHSASMVTGVLQASGIPGELQQLIVTKAEGNPFFIEEVSKSLLESGVLRRQNGGYDLARPVHEIRIPDTIQEVILSRLDRLQGQARDAVQRAAVIGREFPIRLLQRVSDVESGMEHLLDELKSLELIYEKSSFPELAYMFKHALTQEVALSTLLIERRRALHRTVAAAIEELYADRLQEHYEALAYHYYEGEEWEKACEYATQVARRAAALHAPRAVIDHATRAIDSAMKCAPDCCAEEVPPELYLLRARAYDAIGEFELSHMDHDNAIASARAHNDVQAEWQAHIDLGMLWAGRDYVRAGEFWQRAYDLAREIGDERLIASSLNRVANWRVNTAHPIEGLQQHEEALEIFRRLGDKQGLAETLDFLGMTMGLAGDTYRAVEYGLEAATLYRELGNKQGLSNVLATTAFCGPSVESVTIVPTDLESHTDLTNEALDIARDIGWRAGEAYARMQRGMRLLTMGDIRGALDDANDAMRISLDIGHKQWQTSAYNTLASVYAEILNDERAFEFFERAITLAVEIGSQHWYPISVGQYASALVEAGGVVRAEELLAHDFDAALPAVSVAQRMIWLAQADIALAHGDPVGALQVLNMLGDTAKNAGTLGTHAVPALALRRACAQLALGRLDAADDDLGAALERAKHYGMKGLTWRIYGSIAELRKAQGRAEAATEANTMALVIIESIARVIDDPALRATFLEAPQVSRIREAATVPGSL